jgi:septal ring factor EnvC (AmiA/AmiB activator)
MAKLFICISVALASVATALGFMAKNNIDKLQTSLKGTKDDLHREQGKLQTANNDLKKTAEDLGATNDKLKETTGALETKTAELAKKGEELGEAQKQIASQTTEIADMKKAVEDGKLAATELEKVKAEYAAIAPKVQTTEAENAELKVALVAAGDRIKALENTRPTQQVAKRGVNPMSIQGKIVAVNPGWNFVVLNIGDQQGVLANAPLLVIRGNVPIARLRVTSVEPETSVADVIPNSAARGVSVQPGDKVIFEGRTATTELTRPMPEAAPTPVVPQAS